MYQLSQLGRWVHELLCKSLASVSSILHSNILSLVSLSIGKRSIWKRKVRWNTSIFLKEENVKQPPLVWAIRGRISVVLQSWKHFFQSADVWVVKKHSLSKTVNTTVDKYSVKVLKILIQQSASWKKSNYYFIMHDGPFHNNWHFITVSYIFITLVSIELI